MAEPRKELSTRTVAKTQAAPDRRRDAKTPVLSRANEIVRAIGLRPITGLSGPKIAY